MDYFAFQITVSPSIKFANWTYLEKHLKDTITSVGLISEWQEVIQSIKKIELTLHRNSMSSTYNLKTNTLTKPHRLPDADIAVDIYNNFIVNNQYKLEQLKELGIHFSSAIVEKNMTTDCDRVKQTLDRLPHFTADSTSPLRNLIPLHVESTEYGTVYIKQDYVEIRFNDGHIDFIRELHHDLYENVFYKTYKEDLINCDIVRFAFPRQYDYTSAPQYISLGCPDGTCGISCSIDIANKNITTEYLKEYIDQVAEVINKWKTITGLFPNDPIRLENRSKDSLGYYFIFLGSKRDHTIKQFIDLQNDYLSVLIDYLDIPVIDKDVVLDYAYKSYSK
jgi:hypothetical protein